MNYLFSVFITDHVFEMIPIRLIDAWKCNWVQINEQCYACFELKKTCMEYLKMSASQQIFNIGYKLTKSLHCYFHSCHSKFHE